MLSRSIAKDSLSSSQSFRKKVTFPDALFGVCPLNRESIHVRLQVFGLYRQHKKSKAFKLVNLKALALWTFQVITADEESSLRTHDLRLIKHYNSLMRMLRKCTSEPWPRNPIWPFSLSKPGCSRWSTVSVPFLLASAMSPSTITSPFKITLM